MSFLEMLFLYTHLKGLEYFLFHEMRLERQCLGTQTG